MTEKTQGGQREGAGRKPSKVKRLPKTLRLSEEVIDIIENQKHAGKFIEELVMASYGDYDEVMQGVTAEDGRLEKDGSCLASVGDTFFEALNPHIKYKCTGMDLHFIAFETDGKPQSFQTAHFVKGELGIKKSG